MSYDDDGDQHICLLRSNTLITCIAIMLLLCCLYVLCEYDVRW